MENFPIGFHFRFGFKKSINKLHNYWDFLSFPPKTVIGIIKAKNMDEAKTCPFRYYYDICLLY